MPTADQVAHVIVASVREFGVSPLDVATNAGNMRGRAEHVTKLTRARYFAARALVEVYQCGKAAAARMVGVNKHTADVYMPGYSKRPMAWWDDAAFNRICAAAVVSENETTEVVQIIPAFLPAKAAQESAMERFSRHGDLAPSPRMPGKRKLQDILAEAAANTRAMQDRLNDGNETEN